MNKNSLNPLISIITVVLNDEKNIENTIRSVIDQEHKNIQYILVDGGSTDLTLEIINKYKDFINVLVTEKDQGIYDAFNKGLKLAKGDLIGFVNSGDTLTKKSLKYLCSYYNKYESADFFFGAVKKHWGVLHGYKRWKIFYTWGFYSSHSTGFFIKREAAKVLGDYNLKYKYSADYDYFYRMIVHHKMKGVFQRGGYSSKVKFFDHLVECTRIRLDNKQNKFMILITIIIKFIFNHKRL